MTRPQWIRPAGLFVAAFLLYALLPSHNWNYADDSMSWAYRITRPAGLINVHHLFMNGMRVLYHALNRVPGLTVDPARLLALYCALFGALGLVALDALLRLAGLARVALMATLACAFTAGYWTYSIVGDVYVPATTCLLAASYWYCRGMRPGESMRVYGALAATAMVLMMLHHQAFFVFVAGLVPAAFAMRGVNRRRIVYAFAVTGSAAVVVAIIYLAVHRGCGEHESLRAFVSGYAGRTDWRPDQMRFSPASLARAAAGELRAVFSTNLLFRSDAVTQAVQARFPYRNVYPYPFLVRNLPLAAVAVAGLASVLVALLGGVLAVRGLWRGLRTRDVLAVVFTAAVFQALFFAWWEAISDEFWIWSTPVLACALAAGAAAHGRRGRMLAGLVAAGLCVSTLIGEIVPYRDPANDIDAVNMAFLPRAGTRDLVVGFDEIQNSDRAMLAVDRQGFTYFNVLNRARSWSEVDVRELDSEIAAACARGGRVFVGPYLIQPPLSNMAFVRLQNPGFDGQLAALLSRLATLDSTVVVWVRPAAIVPGFFHAAPEVAAPR